MKYSYNLKQLLPLATVFFLSPALRLVPSGTAELAGRGAWVSVPVALPMLILYMYFISRFLKRRQEGEGLAELTLRAHGGLAGRIVLGFWGCGFSYTGASCCARGLCG